MGLEMTELIMVCEETFGVDFREHERAIYDVRTVGDLHRCIVAILQPNVRERCPNVPVFFSLRRALADNVPIAKSDIGLDTRLLDHLSARDWFHRWPALQASLEYVVPSPYPILRYPPPVLLVGIGLFGVLVLEPLVLRVLLDVGTWERWYLLVVLAPLLLPLAAVIVAVSRAHAPIEYHMPAETVRELVGRVVSYNHKGVAPEGISWNDASVWHELRSMISERFDVDANRITPDTDFVKDLGFG